MKTLHLCFAVFSLFALVSCADKESVIVEQQPPVLNHNDDTMLPVDFSMLHIGRALSKGAVDIYDPWLTVFDVTPPERAVADPLATFPVHPFMLVRDSDVRVYSLNSNAMDVSSSFTNVLNEVSDFPSDQPPVQLIEQEPLLP